VRANALRVLGALTAVVAVAVPVAATGPGWARPPAAGLAGVVEDGRLGPGAAVTLGATLLVLARGVAGGRRLAYHLLLAVVLVGLATPVLAGTALIGSVAHRPARWVLGLAAFGALVTLRHDFPARPHPRRLRGAVQIAALGLVVALVRGGWLVAVGRDSPGVSARQALSPLGTGGVFGLVATGLAVVALAVALAPAPAPPPGGPAERAQVAALVAHPESDSLAPFATRADKAYAFSPDGRAAIGYRVVWGTALAGGDPVGATAAADLAIAAFLDTCARNGWRPAVLGARASMVDRWRAQGVRHSVPVGDEAVLDAATFTLASRRMRNVRQAVRRTRNAALTVHIGPADPARTRQLEPVLRDWLHGRPERGFAMNLDRLLRPRPDCIVAVAYDRSGVAQGFARFAVGAGGRVLTLDVAPRRAQAPNGVVERLIVDVLEYGRANGVTEVSLNFAGFRRVYAGSGPAARLAASLAHVLDGWIELGPLYRFTAKFHPRWRPRSVLMRSWLDLGWVGAAALRAEFGRSYRYSAPAPGALTGETAPAGSGAARN
jgi:lysylphosphatidylglycerol synthetase-like protein (DUF2156 family)